MKRHATGLEVGETAEVHSVGVVGKPFRRAAKRGDRQAVRIEGGNCDGSRLIMDEHGQKAELSCSPAARLLLF